MVSHMDEAIIDREVEIAKRKIMHGNNNSIFGRLSLLSIITFLISILTFGTKFWVRYEIKSLASESEKGGTSSTRRLTYMAKVIKSTRELDLLYSNGVEGDPQPNPSNISQLQEESLTNVAKELNEMYSYNYDFQTIYNDLGFDFSKLTIETEYTYKIQGGIIKTSTDQKTILFDEFIAMAHNFEIADPSDFPRSTENSLPINSARRSIFFILNNGFS